MDGVVEVLRIGGVSVLNGLLLALFWAWENLLALLQIPFVLLLLRFVEYPDAQVQAWGVGGYARPAQRRAFFAKGFALFLTLAATFITALIFPASIDVILLLMWVFGAVASTLMRMRRANIMSRARALILTEVFALWAVRLARWIIDLATVSDWAAATGLAPEGAASVLTRNSGYIYMVLLLAGMFIVPGTFLYYLWQELTVLRRSPNFQFATLEEILRDIVGRRREGIY